MRLLSVSYPSILLGLVSIFSDYVFAEDPRERSFILKACIKTMTGYPCIYVQSGHEWTILCYAVLQAGECQAPPEETEIEAPVTWSRKFYGRSQFNFWQNSMTHQYVSTDGHRCVQDSTWQVVIRAEVTYLGNVYTATLTAGGPDAGEYSCCPGVPNCDPCP